jgi:hypothetical protein
MNMRRLMGVVTHPATAAVALVALGTVLMLYPAILETPVSLTYVLVVVGLSAFCLGACLALALEARRP